LEHVKNSGLQNCRIIELMAIETRKVVGQEYSALRGFFRQYELVYAVADERDVIRLRTNYRVDEEVYLYRTTATPEQLETSFSTIFAA